jgi:macrolide transport system ATP-binding/permease protein
MPPALLELQGVSHRYQTADRLALDGIDLRIDQGEFVAIVGPSGSGKSTLLNVLGLLERPTAGTYLVGSADVGSMPEPQRDRLRGQTFGFVFQSANVLGDESVRGNASLGLAIQGVSAKAREEPVRQALEEVGLTPVTRQAARLLSGGERQRLAVARALVTRPAAIFADEPTGNLDSGNGMRVMKLLRSLHDDGRTVVLVTHDLALADAADRRIEMLDGRIVKDSGPRAGRTSHGRPLGTQGGAHRMRAVDTLQAAFSSLLSRPQRALLLLLALVIGIAGLVTAQGISDSAASQVNTRLTDAARDSFSASLPSNADLWRVDDTTLESFQERLLDLEHVRGAAWAGQVAPADVRITRFSPTESEPPLALSLVAASPALFDFLAAESIPPHAPGMLADSSLGPVAILTESSAAALGIAPSLDLTGVSLWVEGHRVSVVGVTSLRNHDLAPVYLNAVFVSRPHLAAIEPERISVTLYGRTDPGYPSTLAPAVPLALAPDQPASVQVRTVADLLGLRVGVAEDMSSFVLIMASVVLVLAVLAGGVGTYLSVVAKTAEIALRRSLGASRWSIFWLFLIQSLVIGVLGGAVGAIAGQLLALGITTHLGWRPVLSSSVGPAGILIGTACGLIAGVVPAIAASRRSPAQAIRE